MKTRFIIFTRKDCDWCIKAKDLLDIENYGYFEWDIDENVFAKEYLRESGFTSVPQVYCNGHYIGGYLALENFLGIN